MSWYGSNWKQRQPVAIDASATAGSGVSAQDIEISVPAGWDLFWDNIRSDFFDVIVVDPVGNLLTFARSGANFANRQLTLQVDGYQTKGQAINQIFVYYQNPDQTSDLASSVTISSALSGYIDLARAGGFVVSQPTLRPPTATPQTAFVKSTIDTIDVYFSVANLLQMRAFAYNGRISYDEIDFVEVQSYDSGGSSDAGRYDITKTRFVEGFVKARAKGGADSNDYAFAVNLTTEQGQMISVRCLIQTRDQLPT